MRILIFLLLANVSFGQVSSRRTSPFFPEPIDTLIVGDWYLKETIIEPYYQFDSMTSMNTFETNQKKIKITKDSLVIPRNERYYKRYEGYNYEMDGNLMKLYFGIKKKRKQVDSLSIELLDLEELVLSSEEYVKSPLGFDVVKVKYIYQRSPSAAYDSLVSILSGKWETASDESIPFLWNDSLAEIHLFKNSEQDRTLKHYLSLSFQRNTNGIGMNYSYSHSTQDLVFASGVYLGQTPMHIDRINQLLYFSGKETLVYHYTFIGSNELILKFVKAVESEKN
ncbi:MAG: hypothetical protein RLZ33_2862 [Bacteroidota bacterium]|jgi:hypothetical protein